MRFIGSGAFGSVYEALVADHGKVAVKLVNISHSHTSKARLESFKREVDVLSRVKHANVVKLHGACMVPPNVFIVMELLEGSLRDKLDACRRLDYRATLKLANEIASALAYLHPSIVHRDLKPQNILMDASGAAKVADFGVAKFKQSTYLNTTRGNGTPAYMAPESFGSDKISEKADVFSLGMILWECWTGEVPWKEVQIPFQVVMLVGVEKRRPEIPEDCPKQLASLIQRCWDDDPHRRPSCAEVERRTRLLLHELDAPPAPPAASAANASNAAEESQQTIA
uniref:Protein kinase domain-containing protein n=1 Tax=Phaeocystis cordata TaxID=118079 RepID=A0A7S1HPR7_9EUKA